MDLWSMCAIAFLVYYSNYMVAPLIPAFCREFAVRPSALGWLVPRLLDRVRLSPLSSMASCRIVSEEVPVLADSSALCLTDGAHHFVRDLTAPELVTLRILCGIGSGGIVTIALAAIGDQYSYKVQGRPMGLLSRGRCGRDGFGF